MNMKKLYVLVRKDLGVSQQAVQAGHAVAEWVLKLGGWMDWTNGILVYLGVESERELERWIYKLGRRDIEFVGFKEPDIGNQYTALAILGNGKLFSRLELL